MKTILYVDEDYQSQIVLGGMLHRHLGHRILLAKDRVEAIECIRKTKPDIIIVDTHLGEAQEIIKFISAMRSPKPYIIALSEDTTSPSLRIPCRGDVFAYLTKPIRFRFLSRVIRCISTQSNPSIRSISSPLLPPQTQLPH